MMNLRKKTLVLALTAAVVGGGASLAQAQVVAPNSLGQALIYPYLAALAQSGWTSFLHVTNTSARTVAAKVRFRSAVDSTDIFDIDVVLSPNDMWTGTVEVRNGQVGWRATDNTCTVPHYGAGSFVPFNPQVSEVYAEVIMMGVANAETGTVATAARHAANGIPDDCPEVEAAFTNPANAIFTPAGEFNVSLNAAGTTNFLTGKFDLVNVGLGQSGAGRATVLADFGSDSAGPVPDTNMYPFTPTTWNLPTLANAAGGLAGVDGALSKTNLINEWVLNTGLGEMSVWTVTFPTKGLHDLGPTTCYQTSPAVYNREEAPPRTPSYQVPLCNEANVIFFRNDTLSSQSVLTSNVSVPVTVNNAVSTNVPAAGWMNLTLPVNFEGPGTPAVGFNLTARQTPADAVVYDHAYLPAPE